MDVDYLTYHTTKKTLEFMSHLAPRGHEWGTNATVAIHLVSVKFLGRIIGTVSIGGLMELVFFVRAVN